MDLPYGGAVLMPMAGVTDAVMRTLCCEEGACLTVSEMLSAKGWIYSGGQNEAAGLLIRRLPEEGPEELQLFGREPSLVADAAARLEDRGFCGIDLNFGCPMPKITGNGEGSALMRELPLMGRIVESVVKRVGLPVTCKMRSGWSAEEINAPEAAHVCEESGCSIVTVHARTRDQMYHGKADRSVIARVKARVNIPVIGNGDIACGEDALDMLRETGCDAVGIGRAAQGNPWIFREINAAVRGEAYVPPDDRERMDTALRHFDMACAFYGKRKGMLEMRKHIAWYTAGMKCAARFRTMINTIDSPEKARDAILRFRDRPEEEEV